MQVYVDVGSPRHVGVVQRDQLQTLGGHGSHVGDRLQKAAAEELIEAVGAFVQVASLPALIRGRLLVFKSVLVVQGEILSLSNLIDWTKLAQFDMGFRDFQRVDELVVLDTDTAASGR